MSPPSVFINRVSAYAVDSTYQQQLRELNDLNWERFKAQMDARFATFKADLMNRMRLPRNGDTVLQLN